MASAETRTWFNPAFGRRVVFAAGISRILRCLMPLALLVASSATGIAEESAAGKVSCEIKPCTGRPTLFFNGAPRFPMAFTSYYPQPFRYKNMADHGVHTYVVILTLTDKWLGGDKPVKWNTRGLWRGQDTIDYSVIEKSLQEVLDADPQAIVLLRIFCDSPAWWDLLHPEETDGGGKPGSQGLRQSFSSVRWRNDTAVALKNIVRFVSSSKFGGHVLGYMLTVGDTEEAARGCDETVCAQKRFREWLFERYGKDEKTVQRLFGKSLEAISIPSAAQRSAGDCGHFLDPQKSQLVIDYRQFHSDQIVESILALCKAVKEASGGRMITGTFYGYTRLWPDTGHLALRRLLNSKDIDFVTTAGATSATETDSVLKAGKLFYSEIDTHTSLCQWISKTRPDIDPQGCYNEARWFGPPTIADSLRDLKKVFAKNLVHGWANWWFDLWGGWYDDEAFLRLFAEAQRVGDESIHLSRKSVAQVAVVLDENSFRYLPYGVAQRGGKFAWIAAQMGAVGNIGAPHDFYLLDDLKDLDLSPYRMIVFLNAFVLSEDQRCFIRDRCMTDNRLLVWVYAPGLIKERLSVDNISSLLGMKVQMDSAIPKSRVVVKVGGKPIAYDGAEVSPLFHVTGGADACPGRTPDNRVVVAEKRTPNCRNVFVAVPPLPWIPLQQYAREAGVHIYDELSDTIFANENYLAITVWNAGPRTIRLPKKAALQELLVVGQGESTVGKGPYFPADTTFTLDFTNRTCRIFRVLP